MARERPRNGGEAYRLGQAGETAPDWVMDDPSGYFLRQYEQGKANPDAPAPADDQPDNPPTAKKSPAGRARQRPAPAKGFLAGVGAGTSAAGKPVAKALPFNPPGGDAGGLLLAVVLYPVALSLVRFGSKGPRLWFRAKFLNIPASQEELRSAVPMPLARAAGGGGGGGVQRYKST